MALKLNSFLCNNCYYSVAATNRRTGQLMRELGMSEAFSEDNQLVLDGTTSIQDLHSPKAFAATILKEIDQAQDIVILSALYLGTGSQESQIVERAEAALKDTANRPNFRIMFFFDHSRGQRGSINSVTLLSDLVKNYHPRVQVFLYQMPQLRGFVNYLPSQLKELLGVYHCKFSVFDQKAILTGANLSEDYFTNRQDRYFLIGPQDATKNKDVSDDGALFTAHSPATKKHLKHTTMASYLTSFAKVVSKDSHELLPGGTLRAPASLLSRLRSTIGAELLELVRQTTESNHDSKNTTSGDGISTANTDPSCPKKSVNYEKNNSEDSHIPIEALPAPTCIYPLIQHAPLQIHQESSALSVLFSQPFLSLHNALLCIATPYTNFRSAFLRTLLTPLQHHCSVELCVPSVPAHGFGNATGLKGFIPLLHFYSLQVEATQFIKSFWKRDHTGASHDRDSTMTKNTVDGADASITSSSCNAATATCHTFYYMRPEWTYHTKGIWLFPASMTEQVDSSGDDNFIHGTNATKGSAGAGTNSANINTNTPATISSTPNKVIHNTVSCSTNHITDNTMMTYIGSSNFGERSWSRDFELGFVITTTEAPLQQLFQKEYVNMRQHCGMDSTRGVNITGECTMKNHIGEYAANNVRRVGGQIGNVVPKDLLPRHNSVQKWMLYSIARIIRSFL